MYKTLCDNQPYAMALFDTSGKCLFFNKKELEYRDIKEKEIFHLFDNFDKNEVFILKRCLSFAQDKKKEVFFEYERNEVHYQLRMLEDDKQNILTTSRNISKEKILEKEVKEEKENINYFSNYLYEVVSLGVPFLPEWANPYSLMYKSEKQIVRSFVKAKIAPNAFETISFVKDEIITKEVFKDICLNGAYSDYFQKKLKKYKQDRR